MLCIYSCTKKINRIVDENGREWEVEEVLLDVSKTGLGFSISGGRDRDLDPVYNDRFVRVTDISPGVETRRLRKIKHFSFAGSCAKRWSHFGWRCHFAHQ